MKRKRSLMWLALLLCLVPLPFAAAAPVHAEPAPIAVSGTAQAGPQAVLRRNLRKTCTLVYTGEDPAFEHALLLLPARPARPPSSLPPRPVWPLYTALLLCCVPLALCPLVLRRWAVEAVTA